MTALFGQKNEKIFFALRYAMPPFSDPVRPVTPGFGRGVHFPARPRKPPGTGPQEARRAKNGGRCPAALRQLSRPAGVRFAVQAAPAALGAFPAPETSGRGSFRAWEAGRRKPAARSSRRAPAPAAASWPRIPADRGLRPGKRPTGARDGPAGRSSGKDSRHTLPPTPCGPWREIPRRIFRRDRRRTE